MLKTFNEIVLAFSSVESKSNALYLNINSTENLVLGFGRYCGKVIPKLVVFPFFWVPALANNVF